MSKIRKQISLNPEDVSRLHDWGDRYDLSEAELVRRAIQAYNPERDTGQEMSDDTEQELAVMFQHMEKAVNIALEKVDAAQARVSEVLEGLGDPVRRQAIEEEVRQEVAAAPGWLDEMASLMKKPGKDAA